jgi:hypothetical protein
MQKVKQVVKEKLKFSNKTWLLIFLAFLVVFYFSFSIILTFDSAHYMLYVEIFEGNRPFASWDIVRGPVFPILIFLSNFLFGKMVQGLLIFTFIFYLIMLFSAYKIIQNFTKEKSWGRKIAYILFSFLVILNPIVFGYYHTLLTEFLAMSISVLSCYLSWKLLFVDFFKNKKAYIFLLLYFVALLPLVWFLKQPYLSLVLFPLLIAIIITLLDSHLRKTFLSKILILFLSIISLTAGIFTWNAYLKTKDIDLETKRETFNVLGYQLVRSLSNFKIIKDLEGDYLLEEKFLTPSELSYISENQESIHIVEVYNLESELIDKMILDTDPKGFVTTQQGIRFVVKAFQEHPQLVLNSYLTNYLFSTNVYDYRKFKAEGSIERKSFKELGFTGCYQNCSIATGITGVRTNIFSIAAFMRPPIENYIQFMDPPYLFRQVLNVFKKPSVIFFSSFLFILPGVLLSAVLYTIFWRRSLKSVSKRSMYLVIILLSYSFFHILLHVITGGRIDRYATSAYITTVLGYLGFGFTLVSNSRRQILKAK